MGKKSSGGGGGGGGRVIRKTYSGSSQQVPQGSKPTGAHGTPSTKRPGGK